MKHYCAKPSGKLNKHMDVLSTDQVTTHGLALLLCPVSKAGPQLSPRLVHKPGIKCNLYLMNDLQ